MSPARQKHEGARRAPVGAQHAAPSPLHIFPHVALAAPCWTFSTYRRALRSIATGSVIEGAELDELRSRIIRTLGVRDAVLCSSGSYALELALRWCDVKFGDEVVIPAFCCSAVIPPILAVGARPVLADVGCDLNLTATTFSAAITRRTRAVIVPHLFGNPAEIEEIAALAHARDIRVIDDAAQALGATSKGRVAGSFGDVGILSFGPEKICSGTGGGALISRADDLSAFAARLSIEPSTVRQAIGSFLATLFWRRWRRWTRPLVSLISQKKLRDPTSPGPPYRRRGMANLHAAIACDLMESLPVNLAARRERVDAYRTLLADAPDLELIPHSTGSACLTQVIRCRRGPKGIDIAVRLVEALCAAGYEVQGSYVPIHLGKESAATVWDPLPRTDRVWADLIELPCEPEVSLDYVKKIAALVQATILRCHKACRVSFPARSRHLRSTKHRVLC